MKISKVQTRNVLALLKIVNNNIQYSDNKNPPIPLPAMVMVAVEVTEPTALVAVHT